MIHGFGAADKNAESRQVCFGNPKLDRLFICGTTLLLWLIHGTSPSAGLATFVANLGGASCRNKSVLSLRMIERRAFLKNISSVCIGLIAGLANGASLPAVEEGSASVYDEKFTGKSTASGERYDGGALTAAHRTLPLGTVVRVTNLDNHKTVRVRINDRGPHVPGRIIDLSSSAAAALGMSNGVVRVRLDVISQPAQKGGEASSRP